MACSDNNIIGNHLLHTNISWRPLCRQLMYRVVTFYILTLPFNLAAQNSFGTQTALRFSASTSYFLCDLGGKDAVGTNDFTDLNLEQTRYAFGFGIQQYAGQFSYGASAIYARLSADDRLTNAGRSVRRLSVRTDVAELGVNIEYTIPRNIPYLKNFYLNLGAGIMIFQPKAEYNGKYYSLRPLGTEGQNYLPDRKRYSHYSPVIPFGFGYKFHFANASSLALDLSLRKSFTDYLDDVSTTYADANIVGEISGDAAKYFADPSIAGRKVGSQRGDSKDNDQYFLIGFRYEFPIALSKSYKINTHCPFQNKTYNISKALNYGRSRHRRFRIFR